jgi:hypothetical protein
LKTLANRQRTFLETGVQRAGIGATIKGLAWSSMWAMVRLELGREPTLYEVAEWWGLGRAQAFRYQQAFRRCWPPQVNPAVYGSPWGMTQCAIDQGVTTERKLRLALKGFKALKGLGLGEAQREQLVDTYTRIVGLAVAA